LLVKTTISQSPVGADRRLYSRLACGELTALLRSDHTIECQVLDISLNGALLNLTEGSSVRVGTCYQIEIPHTAGKGTISADVDMVYVQGCRAGCRFVEIDATSLEVLRELILSLANPSDLDGPAGDETLRIESNNEA
jgi:hypothetical protein